ncbi:hypothetical protein [Peterkaempfera griseoplana]|uniref:hypothetical protein n=1 Tax=Peterkaempfera griseoplana TaxID=66896 RepID=UPI0006E26825|nr:hypothetical protein [Peterkaempfera griseoplana]
MARDERRTSAGTSPTGTSRAAAGPVARSPLAPQWLTLGRDGRLSAYASGDGALLCWTEEAPGSAQWLGPDPVPLPAGALAPTLAQEPGLGYVHLAVLRPAPDARSRHAVLVSTRYQTGRTLSDWRPLDLPEAVDQLDEAQAEPRLSVGPDGELLLFVQHLGKGLWMRIRDEQGRWGAWKGMQGAWVRDPVAARAGEDGSAELLAPYRGGAVHWRRSAAGKPFERLKLQPEAKAAARSYSALETGPGSTTWFWRAADGAAVHAWRPPETAGEPADPVSVGGEGGTGPVAAARAVIDGHDCTVLLQRGADGRTEVAAYPTLAEDGGVWWTPTGPPGTGTPGLCHDAQGRLTLASLGADGSLSISRQKTGEEGLAFGPWSRVGR